MAGISGFEQRSSLRTWLFRIATNACLPANQRMGWSFPWASSLHSNFNFDFSVSFTEESVAPGAEYICLSKARPSLSNTVPYQVRSF